MTKSSIENVDSLRQSARMVVRELGLLADKYQDIGVTLAERHLLIELQSMPNSTVNAIAERLLVNKSSASRLIAKAVKKGFITHSIDQNDFRRRLLQITDEGKNTLNAFEPLAQKQVQDALHFLTPEEVRIVHQGMALFAKGLKSARQSHA